MRVVVTGGAGGVGRVVVRVARGLPFVSSVVVADRAADAAERVARSVGAGVSTVALDVTDGVRLRAILADADVVLNTVGPSYRFGVPMLQAAIDARCHYIDVCDDWEPTLRMLELGEAARDAGVVALIGLGASPGVSNLLARLAIEALDSARAVYTGWDLSCAVPEPGGPLPSAATVHGLHQLTGKVRVWRGGRWSDERPLRRLELEVPGFGKGRVYTIGHPEAVTLPRRWPELDTSLNVMHAPWSHVLGTRVLAGLIDRGWLELRQAARWAEMLESEPPDPGVLMQRVWARNRLPPLFACAEGSLSGKSRLASAAIMALPEGGMGAATGIPLAMGLCLLHDGTLQTAGVWTPEEVVPPRRFLGLLAPYCGWRAGGSVEGFVEVHVG